MQCSKHVVSLSHVVLKTKVAKDAREAPEDVPARTGALASGVSHLANGETESGGSRGRGGWGRVFGGRGSRSGGSDSDGSGLTHLDSVSESETVQF